MYQIGILQLTQNLDDAVHGFKKGLSDRDCAVNFHYCNADGNLAELPKLAASLAEKAVDLIFACSTPAALAAVNLAGSIPVVFTPVFDPVGAGLANSLAVPGGKATGISGMVKSSDKVAFISKLLPHATKIGVLYDQTDLNACLEMEYFRQAALGHFPLLELPINNPADLSGIENRLTADLSALFIPIGRVIEENFATVVYYADAINLPIITSHAPNVSAGALAGLVADHRILGEMCAVQAIQILQGALPGKIPIDIVKRPDILLNSFAAQNLGIEIPADLLAAAKEIFE